MRARILFAILAAGVAATLSAFSWAKNDATAPQPSQQQDTAPPGAPKEPSATAFGHLFGPEMRMRTWT